MVCGSVGRVVASNSRGPLFESSHWQKIILNIYYQLHWKDENKEKRAENSPFKKTKCLPWLGEVSQNNWSPVVLAWVQLLHYIQIPSYFLLLSNPIWLNWRRAVQWSFHLHHAHTSFCSSSFSCFIFCWKKIFFCWWGLLMPSSMELFSIRRWATG